MEINASQEETNKQNGVGEDCTGFNHMGGENIQIPNDPHSKTQYPVTGLSTMERNENGLCGVSRKEEYHCKENGAIGVHNGDDKFQMPLYSSYPFSEPHYPLSGLPPIEREENCKKNEAANAEPVGGEEGDSTHGIGNGDEKFQMPRYSCYPFSNPQHPLNGLLPVEKDEVAKTQDFKKNEVAKKEDCEKNEVVNAEQSGGEKDDSPHGIGRGKDNYIPPPKPTTFNRYKLVDDYIFSDRSLVGRFTRLRPTVQELSQWSKTYWVSKLRSIWMFRALGEGFFKIEFYDHGDCEFVLENGPWFMGVAGLSLKRWTPEFDPQNPGPLKTPVHMTLPDLPLMLWNEESLIKICSEVGRVLQIDNDTTEMSDGSATARVCVEVDFSDGLLPMLDLQFQGMSLKQELDYEGIPFRCKVCRSVEHLEGACPGKSTKTGKKKGAVMFCNGLSASGKAQRMSRT